MKEEFKPVCAPSAPCPPPLCSSAHTGCDYCGEEEDVNIMHRTHQDPIGILASGPPLQTPADWGPATIGGCTINELPVN